MEVHIPELPRADHFYQFQHPVAVCYFHMSYLHTVRIDIGFPGPELVAGMFPFLSALLE